MKFALAISALFVAAASAKSTFKITPMSAKILKESNTGRLDFTVVDISDNAATTCSTAWNVGDKSISTRWNNCKDTNFSFTLPDGIDNIENFGIVLQRTQNDKVSTGSITVDANVGTTPWVCKSPGATPGTSEECDLNGDLIVPANAN
ncbi:hypothetical protein PVAR5_4934 [Paecilomyces variotii No. 5]|uniref:AA1-like domain-containing protein n=1 Tax=Byssochlamys spectabilis (strain No. 5 / NBRC 109023) TaxID=1356009 RepID=V5FFE2_BYSSN|nr:hypothetical protein PVAR5_4934 [Paecilomyces variotii No. 5]